MLIQLKIIIAPRSNAIHKKKKIDSETSNRQKFVWIMKNRLILEHLAK